MRGGRGGRAALLWAAGSFLLAFALGEFAAFSLVSKTITWRRGSVPVIAPNWEGFFLLSAVSIVFAGWCAYHTWRGKTRATAVSPDAS